MRTDIGTPKSVQQAVFNGIQEWFSKRGEIPRDEHTMRLMAAVIENHVIDYLAQKFSVAFLESKDDLVQQLWSKIKAKTKFGA